MEFDDFRAATESAEKHAARGAHREALAVLRGLADSDLPELDRAMVCVHAAEQHDLLGETDAALGAYDRAIALESPLKRLTAGFKKADYLLRLGRKDESRALFTDLLERPEATLAERHSLRARLKLLRRVPGKD
jgi:tetratricopeptide (TPR) repeat protein